MNKGIEQEAGKRCDLLKKKFGSTGALEGVNEKALDQT
jgi:hypothetical protein